VIAIDTINDAYKQIIDGDVRFRYVIDLNTLKRAE
jgi:D-arabinose 1-dehydrogenase-like Zn-dependent alcohol dehydrogenase